MEQKRYVLSKIATKNCRKNAWVQDTELKDYHKVDAQTDRLAKEHNSKLVPNTLVKLQLSNWMHKPRVMQTLRWRSVKWLASAQHSVSLACNSRWRQALTSRASRAAKCVVHRVQTSVSQTVRHIFSCQPAIVYVVATLSRNKRNWFQVRTTPLLPWF